MKRRRKDWHEAMRDGIVSGSIASLTSTAALAAASRIETGHAPATLNATSHWVWGDEAADVDDATAAHTGVGFLIHHAASIFWAVLYERSAGAAVERGRVPPALAAGAAGAAFACFVDYVCVPKRLTPGFELRLSRPSIAAGYVAFGAGLAITSLLRGAARRVGRDPFHALSQPGARQTAPPGGG
jgi:hypothetical protein